MISSYSADGNAPQRAENPPNSTNTTQSAVFAPLQSTEETLRSDYKDKSQTETSPDCSHSTPTGRQPHLTPVLRPVYVEQHWFTFSQTCRDAEHTSTCAAQFTLQRNHHQTELKQNQLLSQQGGD